ncbi:MAG: NADH-quinone oxidoreductase subunit F [Betaproteobacteria bacterium]|nr:MAG: NADH-quinone oxidoreductase subunit F [Betaproteobacteria bacterium]
MDPGTKAEVATLIEGLPRQRDQLIEMLHRIQDAKGCLPIASLRALGEILGMAAAEVYEVATFYHHFDVIHEGEPAPPPVTVRVCGSLSCALAGSEALRRDLASRVGAEVRVVPAPCMGRCEMAPAVVVGGHPVGHATLPAIEAALGAGDVAPPVPAPISCREYVVAGGYRLYAECVTGMRSRDEVIDIVDDAQLRGLGGAGFPAGRKWRIVRGEPAPRFLAVNADEGEPGTFKDRRCLELDPHRFLEGALIAAWAIEAAAIYIYLRDEYAGCRLALERELEALRSHVPAECRPLPPIHLRRGAGAYICGEESAMLESIEGRRGLPRLRPPYVAQRGLFGRPTLEHNLETLFWVPTIVERGAAWFATHGRRGRKGVRAFSVSGRVQRPGVYLAPAGITARELIDEFAGGMLPGHTLYAYLPGGASGGILPASLADIPLDFDTLAEYGAFVGSAAVIVLSDHDRAADAARNVMAFFRDESCGQCTPCREGTRQAAELMRAPRWDRALLGELCDAMADASICGLGQAAPNPIRSVLRYFPHEVE